MNSIPEFVWSGFRAVSEYFLVQLIFLELFRSSFRANLTRLNTRASPEQFQSSCRALSNQFQQQFINIFFQDFKSDWLLLVAAVVAVTVVVVVAVVAVVAVAYQ